MLRSGELDAAMTARAVETICRNARSQTQLISDLLDVSRVLSNKLSLNIESVDLPSTVPVLEAAAPEALAQGVRLDSEIQSPVARCAAMRSGFSRSSGIF